MPLNKTQKEFKHVMLQALKNIDDCPESLLSLFQSDEISVHDRLKVYHNNIIGSLAEVIRTTYPLLEKLVGEDFLRQMAREFIFIHPPSQGCMHAYGEGFDKFIKTYEPAKSMPYLPDIASFEYAMNDAYYAQDDIAMDADALSKIAPEELGETMLRTRHSLHLLQSEFPILDIRNLCLNDAQDAPDLENPTPFYGMVYRPGFDVNIVSLEQDEFTLLSKIKDKKSLGSAIENTLESYPNFNFTNFLTKHISLETFSKL